MNTLSFGCSGMGLGQEKNEDRYYMNDGMGIYLVCDGVGGREGGELAAQMAVDLLSRRLVDEHGKWSVWLSGGEQEEMSRYAREFVQYACTEIYKFGLKKRLPHGMGTTLTMLLVGGEQGLMVHVGDSRLYLVRDGAAHQLSLDHTVEQEMRMRGLMSREEADEHRYGHALTRTLGPVLSVLPDLLFFGLFPGDRLLLCTDGLSDVFGEGDGLSNFVSGLDEVELLAEILVAHVKEKDGGDNATALVVQVEGRQREDGEGVVEWGSSLFWMLQALQDSFLGSQLLFRENLRLLAISRRVEFGVDVVVVEEGQPSEAFYLLLEGECRLTDVDGSVRDLGVGDSFGESALISILPSIETVKTRTEVVLLEIRHQDFAAFILNRPAVGWKLMKNIARERERRYRLLRREMSGALD